MSSIFKVLFRYFIIRLKFLFLWRVIENYDKGRRYVGKSLGGGKRVVDLVESVGHWYERCCVLAFDLNSIPI